MVISLFSISILILFFNFNNVVAQNNEISLTTYSEFGLLESAEKIDTKQCNDSIYISLPSASWNLTDIELNFTDIKLEREIKIIENNSTDFGTLRAAVPGLGVQMNISAPTTIFGVYIFGAAIGDVETELIYVQITGYNSGNNEPNDTIYGSTSLNISGTLGWHLQTFDEGIPLSPGQYYLIINATEFTDFDNLNVYWFFNDENPIFPNLYVASYYWGLLSGWSWKSATQDKPFLYKIIQRTNRSYYPENINMTAEIGENFYPILNGTELGTGYLKAGALNFSPNEENVYISIKNNKSVKLFFNLSYKIGIKKEFFSAGSAIIKENLNINWTLTPEISRIYQNYSVKFTHPNSWYNLNVFRDGQNITSQIVKDNINNYIHILDNTIINGASWLITANSPNIDISLDVPITNYEPKEILYFYINPPISPGNITIFLIDAKRVEVDGVKIEINETISTKIEFTHHLPSTPNDGNYKAFVFWNNATDAGIQTQTFLITMPFILDPILVVLIATIIIVIGIASFTTFKVIKRTKKIHEEHRQSIFNKYMDMLNLDYLIIVEKNSGLNVYDQVLAGKSLDASLISGFLHAIQSFGIDLTGSDEQSQTIKLEYQNSKILMSEFKNFRLTLIMKEKPSQDFLQSVELLSYDIDEKYGERLENFDGEISQFEGIKELVEKRLPISLIYPLNIEEIKGIKLKQEEKSIINRARSIMKEKNVNYFFVSNLISKERGFQVKEAEIILNLIVKKIFKPLISSS